MRRTTAGLAALVLVVLMAAPVGAALKPTVHVTKNTELVNLQRVKVIVRRFPPHETILVMQCSAQFPQHEENDCAIGNGGFLVRTLTSSAGYAKVKLKVETGPIGANGGSCGTSSDDNNCVMAAIPDQGGVIDTTHAVTAPISFALPG